METETKIWIKKAPHLPGWSKVDFIIKFRRATGVGVGTAKAFAEGRIPFTMDAFSGSPLEKMLQETCPGMYYTGEYVHEKPTTRVMKYTIVVASESPPEHKNSVDLVGLAENIRSGYARLLKVKAETIDESEVDEEE